MEVRETKAGWMSFLCEAHEELTERKSVFIGHAKPVQTEEEALCFIREMKHRYADARHNVYAYLLREGNTARYSDDGEPQGTAGIPVLDILRKRGITDAVIVVTRYFGGILLGTGGLVRAYSAAAGMAADSAGLAVYTEKCRVRLVCDYGIYQKIVAELPAFSATVTDSDFAECVTLYLRTEADMAPALIERICEITAGRVIPTVEETYFGL